MKKTYITPVTMTAGTLVRETTGSAAVQVEDGILRNPTGSLGYNL